MSKVYYWSVRGNHGDVGHLKKIASIASKEKFRITSGCPYLELRVYWKLSHIGMERADSYAMI